MWILWWSLAVFALSIAAVLLFLLFDLILFSIRKWNQRRMWKKVYRDLAGARILAERLERQRKTQLRMMKEAEASDSNLFDKVEEARRDFE